MNDYSDPNGGTDRFLPPSINFKNLFAGNSYAHYCPCPPAITPSSSSSSVTSQDESTEPTECVLGIDEAGRGPVLGPMVYSAFYLPTHLHHPLLADEHQFNDSKVLTPEVRAGLMKLLCTQDNSLNQSCGWATKLLSARDISTGMFRPGAGNYNLNAQAMDATVEIIRGIVEDRAINIKEVYIDTIGNPQTYQNKLERIFPTMKITVAKKADSLYPCVSAASVCAKVTRDIALETCYEAVAKERERKGLPGFEAGWGSGYPSDSKCVNWLKSDMDVLFGWGNECRFSWGTARELLEQKGQIKVDWPVDEDEEARRMTDFFSVSATGDGRDVDELRDWYGQRPKEIF